MCLLAVCENGIMPEDNFREAFRINDDGFGFAWIFKGKLNYLKGFMDVDKAWDAYKAFSKEKLFPHVIHFRLGSPTLDLLTHPFDITTDSELKLSNITTGNVLFHNGVIAGWKDRMWDAIASIKSIPKGPVIDTRVAAILCACYGEDVFRFIEGKFVIFGPDTLSRIGDFEEDTEIPGIWFSNKSYKVKKSYSNNNYNYNNNWMSGFRSNSLFSDKNIDDFIDEFIV